MSVEGRKLEWPNKVLAGLQEAVADIIAEPDLQAVLQKTAERTADLVAADIATIHILDPITGGVRAAAGYGVSDRETFEQHKPGRGKAGLLVVRRGAPLIAEDVSTSELAGPFATREGVQSAAGFPLTVADEVIGVLFVSYRERHRFGPEQIEILTSFANLAAVAIDKARLYSKTQEQVDQLSALVNTAQVINRFVELDSICEPVFEQAFALVGREVGWIALVERDNQIMRIVASRGIPQESIDAFHRRPTYAHEGTFGLVMDTGEIQEFTDAQHDRRVLDMGLPIPEQLANIPLNIEGQVIGILTLDALIPNEPARQALAALADMTAVAVDKAKLFGENEALISNLSQKNKELQALNKIGQAVSALGVDETLKVVYEQTSKLMDTGDFFICLYDKDQQKLNFKIWMHKGQPVEVVPSELSGLTRWVVERKEPLLIRDWDEEESNSPVKADIVTERQRSWLGVPLLIGEEVLGVISVQSPRPDAFDLDTQQILEIVANQAAVAIENARLLEGARRRIRDLEIVKSIAQIVSTKLDPEELLEAIVTQIADELNCTHCTLFFPERDNGDVLLVPRVTHGERSEQIMTRRFRRGQGLAGLAFQTGKSIVLPDARGHPAFEPAREAQDKPRSMLVVPIIVGDQTIGVISADQDEYGWFGDSEQWLVETLARQAGVAIERARGLTLVQDIGSRIIGAPKVGEILQYIVSGSIELTNTTSGVIYLLSEDGKTVIDSYEHPPDFEHPPPRTDKKGGLTRLIVETGEMLIFPDIRKDPRVNKALHDRIRSMIAVPLKLNNRVIGVLYLNDEDPHRFTDTEITLVLMLVNQAASVLQSAERRVQDISALAEINRAILVHGLDETTEMIAVKAAELTQAQYCVLRLVDSSDCRLVAKASSDPMRKREDLLIGEGSFTGWVASQGKAAFCSNVREDEHYLKWYEDVQSCMAAPLWHGDKLIGTLYVESTEIGAYSEGSQLELLQAFANQAAIAIENARLSQERARRMVELEVLTDIGRTVSSLGIDEIVDLVYWQMAKIMDLDNAQVQIALYDETEDEVTFPLAIEKDDGRVIDTVRWGTREIDYRKPGEDKIVKPFQPRPRGGRFGLTEYVIHAKHPVLIPEDFLHIAQELRIGDTNVKVLPRFGRLERPTQSWVGVPMTVQDRVVGIISIQSLEQEQAFDHEQVELLTTVAAQAAVAIENARLYENMERQVQERTEAWQIAEQERLEAEKWADLGKIAGSVAHRIGNKGGVIRVHLLELEDYLGQLQGENEAVLDSLDAIWRNNQYLLNLSEYLFKPQRAGAADLELSDVSLLVKDALQNAGLPDDITVKFRPGRDIPKVPANKYLVDAFVEVVDNAAEAMQASPEKTLSIDMEFTENFLEIRFTDTGPGISKKNLDEIFDLFSRADDKRLASYQQDRLHQGFGLWWVRSFLNKIGGEIQCESELGTGTTFTLRLPAEQRHG